MKVKQRAQQLHSNKSQEMQDPICPVWVSSHTVPPITYFQRMTLYF
jgi:hypothetical protein